MSFAEAQDWAAYSRKRGTFNIGVRLEFGFAMLATLLAKSMGVRAEFRDFMPNLAAEDEGDATLGDVMDILRGVKK